MKSPPKVADTQTPTLKRSPERALQLADEEWSRTFDQRNREYDAGMVAVWHKYRIALAADTTKMVDGKWGTYRDYDDQYDRDRLTVLARFQMAMNIADAKLDHARKVADRAKIRSGGVDED